MLRWVNKTMTKPISLIISNEDAMAFSMQALELKNRVKGWF